MRKTLALALAFLFLFSLTACSKNNTTGDMNEMTSMGYKVGIGSYTTTSKSASSTGTANGKSVVSTTYVTAVFDKDNVIKKIYIDEVETKAYFDTTGQLVPSDKTEYKTKRELGYDYNMKAASPIGKEWFEQIDALENYLVGKNVSDIIKGVDTITDNSSSMGNSSAMNETSSYIDGSSNSITDGINPTDSKETRNGTSSDSMGTLNDSLNDNIVTDSNLSDNNTIGNTTNDYGTGNSIVWQEDLKSSVTIDLTNIQMAIKKAYDNAK